MKRRDFLKFAAAASAFTGCSSTMPKARNWRIDTSHGGASAGLAALSAGAADPRMRGPFPIMTMAYNEDGSVDYDSLVREAKFVADAGCPGVIWCQSNDSVDLLTLEEKKKGYEALAAALEGNPIMLTLGCNGDDAEQMLKEITAVEETAARHPKTNIAVISRPPKNGKTLEDVRDYYEKLAKVAKRPVIIQTVVCPSKCPSPTVEMLITLARRYPKIYGYIKEETDGNKANDNMIAENAAKPVIHTVFSAWGGWQWLYQSRRCGSEGLITERCPYAPLLAYIWKRMEDGDSDGTLTQAFALYRLLIDQRGFPRGDMRGYALYYFKRLGLFKNTLTRQYEKAVAKEQGTEGSGTKWKIEDLKLTDLQKAELDQCYDDAMRFVKGS